MWTQLMKTHFLPGTGSFRPVYLAIYWAKYLKENMLSFSLPNVRGVKKKPLLQKCIQQFPYYIETLEKI
jgi:hypothetical protein